MKYALIVSILSVFFAASPLLSAKDQEQSEGSDAKDKKFPVPVCIGIGPTVSFDTVKGYTSFGGEFSVFSFYLKRGRNFDLPLFFGGIYSDYLYQTQSGRSRFSLGPELGFLMFGIDGGIVYTLKDGGKGYGYTLRPFVVFPHKSFKYLYPVFFYRFLSVNESGEKVKSHELGLSVKAMFQIAGT